MKKIAINSITVVLAGFLFLATTGCEPEYIEPSGPDIPFTTDDESSKPSIPIKTDGTGGDGDE